MLALALCALPKPARAQGPSVVVEIDAAAERAVDARSARRLVPLELADVRVPGDATRGAPALFFRILGDHGALRVELWQRGEFHGARTLNSAGENPQLVARRVALAAAELGRRLARKREATLAREERLRSSRAAHARELAERTQEGPVALRSELFGGAVSGEPLVGARLTGELALRRSLRLEVGGEAGQLIPPGEMKAAELWGVRLGPARRWVLTRRLDLDVGLIAAANVLYFPRALSVDAIPGEHSTWTARLGPELRLELRLSRQVRLTLGGEIAALLRPVPFQVASAAERLHGLWWGGALGLVVTPP